MCTGTGNSRSTPAMPPMWSRCPCVSQIASSVAPDARTIVEQLVGLVARIDQHRAIRRLVDDEIGVLLERTDGPDVDLHAV